MSSATTAPASLLDDHLATVLDDILRFGSVRSVFQPIVDLETGSVVAYEALARGPKGPLQAPDDLFATARAAGRLAELDELCRRVALTGAIEVGIVAPLTLFVNVEPEILDTASLGELLAIADAAPSSLQLVLEITERAIAARPAELLATVQALRHAGWRIALDDVGADDLSLAFMPLLRPDIVKLDLRLVQRRPGPAVAQIMHAVNAYAERTGAVLLAEGIEDASHLAVAQALGARLGQGWMLGRPGPVPVAALEVGSLRLADAAVEPPTRSPFACLPDSIALRRSAKPLLIQVSKHLEREALRLGSTCVVVAAFENAAHFTPATAHRYRELAATAGFVGALGVGLSAEPVAGVRGSDLDPGDPVRGEWDLVVLGPHFAAALLARDLGDSGPDLERTFEFALTYDRDVVAAAAAALMTRVLPRGSAPVNVVETGAVNANRAATGAVKRGVAPAGDLDRTLRKALAATGNGVYIADATTSDSRLVYVNTAFEKLSGLRAEDVLGRNYRPQGPDTDPAAAARIRTAISEGREIRETILNYRAPHGTPWWNEIFLSPVFDEQGHVVQYIGVQSDVTARVVGDLALRDERALAGRQAFQLEELSHREPLTRMLTGRSVREPLDSALLDANLCDTSVALLLLEVDRFTAIDHRYGNQAGDAVLAAVSERLQSRLRHSDLVARLCDDQFLVVLTGLDRAGASDEAHRLAAVLSCALGMPVDTGRDQVPLVVSAGVSVFPAHGQSFDDLLHAASGRLQTSRSERVRS